MSRQTEAQKRRWSAKRERVTGRMGGSVTLGSGDLMAAWGRRTAVVCRFDENEVAGEAPRE